jgi:hypothetical protein
MNKAIKYQNVEKVKGSEYFPNALYNSDAFCKKQAVKYQGKTPIHMGILFSFFDIQRLSYNLL